MRRRAQEKRKRVFIRALSAAKEIGMVDGLAGLTARRIALRVPCSVGTLYNVFGNLDTLILHLNGQTLDGLYEALTDVEISDEPKAAVRQITKCYRRYTVENALLWSVIFEHVWPAEYVLPEWYPEKIHRLLAILARALKPLLPGAGDDKVLQAASVLWSGLHGINSLAVTGKIGLISSESANAMTDLMVQSFVGGLPMAYDRDG
jgi:AcrR family transcriptional regulator